MEPKNKIAHKASHKTGRGSSFRALKVFQVHCKAPYTEGTPSIDQSIASLLPISQTTEPGNSWLYPLRRKPRPRQAATCDPSPENSHVGAEKRKAARSAAVSTAAQGRKPKFGLSAGISHAGGKAGVGQYNLPRAVLRLVPSTGFFGLAPKENIFLLRICF